MTGSRPRGDDGSALLEFTYLAVLLMVPLVYVLTTTFQVQQAAFGVTEAARQAARAFTTSATAEQAAARAQAAAELALRDQGIELREPIELAAPDALAPGSTVRVTVEHRVELPLIGGLFAGAVPPHIPVRATSVQVVDRFRAS